MDLNNELQDLKSRIKEYREYLNSLREYPYQEQPEYVKSLFEDVIDNFEKLDKEIKRNGILPFEWGSLVSEAPVQLPNQKIREPEHALNYQ